MEHFIERKPLIFEENLLLLWGLTIRFSKEKIYRWKLMWADMYFELVEWTPSFQIILNDKKHSKDCFQFAYTLQLFAYSMRIFALKKIFLTSSKHFNETNLKKYFLKLATNHMYINMKCLDDLRHSEFFKFVSCSFMAS